MQTHARTQAHTQTYTHTGIDTRTHAYTHTHTLTHTHTQSRWLIDQKFIVLEREDYELQPLNSLFANICLGNYGYTASIFFESCQTFGSLKLYPYIVLTLSLTNMAYLMSYRANNFLSTLAYSIT